MKYGWKSIAVYAAGGALFLSIGALNFWKRELFPGTAVLALEWIWLSLGMFRSGYRCASERRERTPAKREDADEGAERCPACGCKIYTLTAGRRICACCGTVWSHGPEM